jgi:NAD(P)-dependent dehydrogenase (short-subunit alcohol dehydrogenase family)
MTTILITGGHSGIGLATVRTLAAQNIDIVLAGRSLERMRQVADELRAAHGVTVTTLTLDTSSLASVRTGAAQFRMAIEAGEIDSLDAILCNAGGRFDGEVSYSPDGYETTFATNCLGHFLFVELLLPSLAEQGTPPAVPTTRTRPMERRLAPLWSRTPSRWQTTARAAARRCPQGSATPPRNCAR